MNKAKLEDIKCNWLDLESLGSWLTMPKNFLGTGFGTWLETVVHMSGRVAKFGSDRPFD